MSAGATSATAQRLALVAMPWSRGDRPSAALAALGAYVARERPAVAIQHRSEFVEVAQLLGDSLYDRIADDAYEAGELLYGSLLHPEKAEEVGRWFEGWVRERFAEGGDSETSLEGIFERVRSALAAHVEAVAEDLAASATIVGFTTSFGQLFANLALSRAIKRRAPHVVVVLGGSTVSARSGPKLLSEYADVDYIVQGEGELPVVALLDSLDRGERSPEVKGLLTRERAAALPNGVPLWEVASMDDLPTPDYDEYAERAERHGIDWHLPLEGSRGCWWDRTKRTGDPESTCYFCNLNIQWGGYREKSTSRIAAEMAELSDRHKVLKAYFVDNILRSKGADELGEAIKALGKDFEIFYELRANIRPHELLAMWEAGLRTTQFGIEALSSSVLRRMGKGTTAIQNLQAMRLCTELGVQNNANLIVDFPSSTEEEVEETRQTIVSYALGFEPLMANTYHLTMDSTVDARRDKFGVTNVRNADAYRRALPERVWSRLALDGMAFDVARPAVSWDPVREACRLWSERHERARGLLLVYRDGGSFLNVEDGRFDAFQTGTFVGLERAVYLYCMQARTREQIARRCAAEASDGALDAVLAGFVDAKIMFQEGDRFLSLAVATSPSAAARRIREARAEDEARRPRVVRLPIRPSQDASVA